MNTFPSVHRWLWLGDAAAIALVSLWGFSFHGGLESPNLNRVLALYLPYLAAWSLAGIPLGVFDLRRSKNVRQLWRVVWAMGLATPFAAWLRSFWLGTPVVPIFVAVLFATGSAGLLIWRLVFIFGAGRRAGVSA